MEPRMTKAAFVGKSRYGCRLAQSLRDIMAVDAVLVEAGSNLSAGTANLPTPLATSKTSSIIDDANDQEPAKLKRLWVAPLGVV